MTCIKRGGNFDAAAMSGVTWQPHDRKAVAQIVVEAKTQSWEEFGEAKEKNHWLASKIFC